MRKLPLPNPALLWYAISLRVCSAPTPDGRQHCKGKGACACMCLQRCACAGARQFTCSAATQQCIHGDHSEVGGLGRGKRRRFGNISSAPTQCGSLKVNLAGHNGPRTRGTNGCAGKVRLSQRVDDTHDCCCRNRTLYLHRQHDQAHVVAAQPRTVYGAGDLARMREQIGTKIQHYIYAHTACK